MKTFILSFTLGLVLLFSANGQQGRIRLIASFKEKTDPSFNIVYSPAFCAAWTMLKEDIVKEDIKIKDNLSLVQYLNEVTYRPACAGHWVVQAGFTGKGIIDSIKNSMKLSFGKDFTDLDEFKNEDEAIICLACFNEDVSFNVPFETMEWNFISSGKNTAVSCFGVARSENTESEDPVRDQVKIYDYRNPDDFIAVIHCRDKEKEIILAKTGFRRSLSYMRDLIYDRIEQTYAENLAGQDELIIPRISLSAIKSYSELIDRRLVNKGFEDYFFVRAEHRVDFKMEESGASVKAGGTIVMKKGPVPRIYSFDKPFFVIVKEKNASVPDLLAWIVDDEFLVKTR